MTSIKVSEFFRDNRRSLGLEKLTGERGFDNLIINNELHRPGLALSGFVDIFTYDRIQVLGNTEIAYLKSLTPHQRNITIKRMLEFAIPCMVVTNKNPVLKELLENCERKEIPLFRSPLNTTQFVRKAGDYLEEKFAPSISVHGTLVDVYGIGVLLSGKSGIGKSEVALDLVERGHRLVADDVVTVKRKGDDILIGTGNDVVRHYIEIRGLGIIDIRNIFGIRAIRQQKRVEVQVVLEEWSKKEDYERLGLEEHYTDILGVKIPEVHLPIFPGKNVTVIVETIALTTLLKIFGIYPAKEFNRRLMKILQKKGETEKLKSLQEYLEHDIE